MPRPEITSVGRRTAVSALILLVLLSAGPVAAQAPPTPYQGDSLGADWREQQNEARQKVQEGRHVPLGQVIESIRRRAPGRLLDTGIEQGPDGRSIYRVRWAGADGRRVDFLVDAHSGAILSSEGK